LFKFILFILLFINYYIINYIFITRECSYNNHINSLLRFDNLNKFLILITFIILFTSFLSIKKRVNVYVGLFVLSILIFSTLNIILFFLLLERVLLPIIYLFYFYREYKIRMKSLSYIFIITLIFRSPLLIFIIYYINIRKEIYNNNINIIIFNSFNFFLLIIRFLIKLPVYGFHIWLPKAHVDAPIRGSITLARVILKYRRYGLFRCFIIFKSLIFSYNYLIIIILIRSFGYFLISYVCIQILDLKILIAFSSVSHISFAIIRTMSLNYIRLKRSILMYIGHRIISPIMFYFSYILYNNFKTRLINNIKRIRKIKNLFLLRLLINLRLPPFINFFSEIYIFTSIYFWLIYLLFILFIGFFVNGVYHIKLLTFLTNYNLNNNYIKNDNFFFFNSFILFSIFYFFFFFSFVIMIIF